MYKKGIVLCLSLTLVFAFAVTLSAQTTDDEVVSCGFFAKLLGRCAQTANVLDGVSSTSGMKNQIRDMKLASSTSPEMIRCVGTAVATRETLLSGAMNTFSQTLSSAYSKRSRDLSSAYAQTSGDLVKSGIKLAWTNYASSTKDARKNWKTSRETAWKSFKASVKLCNAPKSITDINNQGLENSGE